MPHQATRLCPPSDKHPGWLLSSKTAKEVEGGWIDAETERMVQTYDPEHQFIVVIQEDKIWSVYKCAFGPVTGGHPRLN